VLDQRIRQVTLIHAPASFSALAEAPMQSWPFSAMLPGVLEAFDLPDVYRELAASTELRLLDPWAAKMAEEQPPGRGQSPSG